MLTRKQVRKMKRNNRTKKVITTSALTLGVGLGLAAFNSNKVSAATTTWTANSISTIQSALKSEGSAPYTIKWGDTLSTIVEAAKKNGVDTSVEKLAQINKIANVDLIYAGNKLWFNAKDGSVTVQNSDGTNNTYNVGKGTGSSNTGNTTNGGNGSATTPSRPGNGGSATNPSNPGNNGSNNGGGTTNPGGNDNGGNNNGGGNVTPPQNNIYTPNANAIKQNLMSLINLSANGKYWGIPTGKAPSGADWISTAQHLSAYGNSDNYTSDMAVAKQLYSTFIQDNLTDPSYVSANISNIEVTGTVDKNTHKGMITVKDVTIDWYADPFYGLDM